MYNVVQVKFKCRGNKGDFVYFVDEVREYSFCRGLAQESNMISQLTGQIQVLKTDHNNFVVCF